MMQPNKISYNILLGCIIYIYLDSSHFFSKVFENDSDRKKLKNT